MNVVTVEERGPVSIIAINRPHKRNALNKQAALEMQAAFIAFEDSAQRVAVLTGNGDAAFCAGADVSDMPEFWRCCPGVGFDCTKPIVAAVSGWCIGGGLVMAMLADLMVASETARFSYPEAKVGYTSGIGSGLAARIPHKIAMELLLLGGVVDARRAYEVGFANRLVPAGQHLAAALEYADQLARNAPLVMKTLKTLVNRDLLNASAAQTAAIFNRNDRLLKESEDCAEGTQAFLAKRPPSFRGR